MEDPCELAYRRHIDSIRRPLESIQSKTPDDQEVLLDKDERTKIARIIIKSGAKNALSGRMISRLVEVVDELYEWPGARALVLMGHGGTFCSGSDLTSVRATANSEHGLQLAQIMQYTMWRIQRLPLLSLSFVQGFALGGGAELALATDLRLMSEEARLGFVHIKVGVCCGWGGGSRLVELVGPARALELLSSGRLVGSQEAQQLGLCEATCASLDEALAYAARHALGSPATLGALKAMINATRPTASGRECRSLATEAQLFASTWGQPDHLAGLAGNIKHNSASSKPEPEQ